MQNRLNVHVLIQSNTQKVLNFYSKAYLVTQIHLNWIIQMLENTFLDFN